MKAPFSAKFVNPNDLIDKVSCISMILLYMWVMYGHNLVPKLGILVSKIANLGFFVPKPYLNGSSWIFFYQQFCSVSLVKILKILTKAWPLRMCIFHIIQKHEYHQNGKTWPKTFFFKS